MKIAIYTAQVGKKGNIQDPPKVFKGVDYIAFTDKTIKSNVWKAREPLMFSSIDLYSDRRNAKVFKVLPNLFLPEYDATIWVDSDCYCNCDPSLFLENNMPQDDQYLTVFRHPRRRMACMP
jgi:hypothetical protein